MMKFLLYAIFTLVLSSFALADDPTLYSFEDIAAANSAGNQLVNVDHFDYSDALSNHGWIDVAGSGGSGTIPDNSLLKCTGSGDGNICTSFAMDEISHANTHFGFSRTDGAVFSIRLNLSDDNGASIGAGLNFALGTNTSANFRHLIWPAWDEQRTGIEFKSGPQNDCDFAGIITVAENEWHVYDFVLNFSFNQTSIFVDDTFLCTRNFTGFAGGALYNFSNIGNFDSSESHWEIDYMSFEESLPQTGTGLGGCSFPCLFYEPFDYNANIINNGWVVTPLGTNLNANQRLFLPTSSTGTGIFHGFVTGNYPVMTMEWNQTISNSSVNPDARFVVLAGAFRVGNPEIDSNTGLLSRFSYPAILHFYNDSATNLNVVDALIGLESNQENLINQRVRVCNDCFTEGLAETWSVTFFFEETNQGEINNETYQFTPYDRMTYAVKKEGIVQKGNLRVNAFFPQGFTDRFSSVAFSSSPLGGLSNRVRLDEIRVFVGTNFNEDNSQDLLPISGINSTASEIEQFGVFSLNTSSGIAGFNCVAHSECCKIVDGELKVKSQMCVIGAISTGFLDSVANWAINNLLYVIIIALLMIGVVPFISKLARD